MDKLTKEYQILKNVVAKSYGIILDEYGNGSYDQIISIAKANTFNLLYDFQLIFDNVNLYHLYDIKENREIIKSCYRVPEVGLIYNRIANLYLIIKSDNQTNVDIEKIIDDEWSNLYLGYKTLREITSVNVNRDMYLYNEKEHIFTLTAYDKIIYILNIYLSYYIRQIHDELFGFNTIERYIEDPKLFDSVNKKEPKKFSLI